MTLAEVKAARDKYYAALLELPATMLTHSIEGASYDWDSHRANLQEQFQYWDNLYNVKLSAGQTLRMDTKSV